MRVSGLNRVAFLSAAVLLPSLPDTALGSSGGITVLPDWSVGIQVVNFVLLIFLLNLVLYKPIRNILIQRKNKIEGLEQNIQNSQSDVKEKENAWNTGIREARTKGLQQKETLIQEAQEKEKKIVEEINAKAQADLLQMRRKIEQDIEGVRTSLLSEIDGFADAISQKILGRAA
jgi:F-type H+-transporting ATPase subunit b